LLDLRRAVARTLGPGRRVRGVRAPRRSRARAGRRVRGHDRPRARHRAARAAVAPPEPGARPLLGCARQHRRPRAALEPRRAARVRRAPAGRGGDARAAAVDTGARPAPRGSARVNRVGVVLLQIAVSLTLLALLVRRLPLSEASGALARLRPATLV